MAPAAPRLPARVWAVRGAAGGAGCGGAWAATGIAAGGGGACAAGGAGAGCTGWAGGWAAGGAGLGEERLASTAARLWRRRPERMMSKISDATQMAAKT